MDHFVWRWGNPADYKCTTYWPWQSNCRRNGTKYIQKLWLDSGRALCHKHHAELAPAALFVSERSVWEARNTQLSLGHHLAVDACERFLGQTLQPEVNKSRPWECSRQLAPRDCNQCGPMAKFWLRDKLQAPAANWIKLVVDRLYIRMRAICLRLSC